MRDLISKILGGKPATEEAIDLSQSDEQMTMIQKTLDATDGVEVGSEVTEHSQDGQLGEVTDNGEPNLDEDIVPAEEEAELDQTTAVNVLEETAVSVQDISTQGKAKTPVLKAVQKCHIGNVRSRNEDSTYIFTAETGGQDPLIPFGLYIVADGMGGHHAGHEASKGVSRLVAQHVLERIYFPLLKNSIGDNSSHQEPVSEVILDAVQIANQHIHSPDPGKDSGTTLTAALVFGRRLYVAHVGDSRAYLLDDGEFKQITTDHSYVRRLQDAGQLTDEEAAIHPQRNMLYRAVGQGGKLDIDTFTQSLPNQGKIFLCSDGLWGLVDDQILRDVIQQDVSLGAMADVLVDLALQAGGHDNISAVLVDFSF